MRTERHHILFNRKAWSANDELNTLRSDSQLIVPLEHDEHLELHQSISHVPPLSYHIARRALHTFDSYEHTDDHLEATERLQRSIEGAARHPRADMIEREIAWLATYALEIQKPFIETQTDNVYIDLGHYGKTAS